MTKQYQLNDVTTKLNKRSLANTFNVYSKDVNGSPQYYYNVLNGLSLAGLENVSRMDYSEYQVRQDDSWSTISWRSYGTIRLWWLICKFNGIDDPMVEPEVGDILRVPNARIVDSVISAMRA
jgi:hypothetical protein